MISGDELYALFQAEAERKPFVDQIESSQGFDRVLALRQFYALANKEILRSSPRQWAIDPYEVNWPKLFTPIEAAIWHDIRSFGLVAYPQYPVGRYIADFANPVAQFAIECDGAAYHQDKEKDRMRDREMSRLGFFVYRISGRDCLTDSDPDTGEPGVAGRLIRRIKEFHL